MSERPDTRLCLSALEMVVRKRRPASGLIHHSDRGCQYASHDYREALRQQGIEASMSRRGDYCDKAVAESFWGTLKNELADEMDVDTRVEARRAIFEYIESFVTL